MSSYPKVYALGHRQVADILLDEVYVEEKVDGSQFSFGDIDGEFKCRSRGKEQYPQTDKMFDRAVETAKRLYDEGLLVPGWTYSGEYLNKPKHNTLAYERTPEGCIILFDIRRGEEDYVYPAEKFHEAARLGLEVVPVLMVGKLHSAEDVRCLLDTPSVLGGCKIEGVVVKNYKRFGHDGKVLLGKFVSEAFKEKHQGDWKKRHASKADLRETLKGTYRCEARWRKAVERSRDNGTLLGEPKDIGPLVVSVQNDVVEECKDEIMEKLWDHYRKNLERDVVAGFAEWYKMQLLEEAFA